MKGSDNMNIESMIIYFFFMILSLIPVVKLDEVRTNKQYRVLWFLSVLVFTWAILIGFNLISKDIFIIYYTRLLAYPIVFAISYLFFVIFQIYTKHETPRYLHVLAMVFFLIDLVLNLYNSSLLWILSIPYSPDLTREVYLTATRGWFFMLHTVLCYVILLFGFIQMFIYLKRKDRQYKDVFPFPMILISLIMGVTLNIIHLFVYSFEVDPTFIFIVIITFILYMIIYKHDFSVNMILSSKKLLFSKMREMYVIADHHGHVIEYSNNLQERFNQIQLKLGESTKEFYRKIKMNAVIYRDIGEIKDLPFEDKKFYLHIDAQDYRIDRFRENGELILLYDETLSVKMMNEIEEIRIHDQMSKLYSRNFFEENRKKFEKEYERMGLIMFDVDGLKLFNDYLGHEEGDRLIRRFSEILLGLDDVYDDLIAIRFGGDEFVLLVKNASQRKIDDILTHIIDRASSPDVLENISFSHGKTIRRPYELLKSMLKRADDRLYQMKVAKKNYKEKLIEALEIEAKKNEHKEKDDDY